LAAITPLHTAFDVVLIYPPYQQGKLRSVHGLAFIPFDIKKQPTHMLIIEGKNNFLLKIIFYYLFVD